MQGMDRNQAVELWTRLAAHGTAPTDVTSAARVLPSYTAGIGPWIDRLSNQYLGGSDAQPGLCQSTAHFKLVLARIIRAPARQLAELRIRGGSRGGSR